MDQFLKLKLREDSTLSEIEMKRTLDEICLRNAGLREFNP